MRATKHTSRWTNRGRCIVSRRRALWAGLAACLLLAFAVLWPPYLEAKPERIRAGIAYYSDSYVVTNGIPDLGPEKNYEEVYLFYEFFEAHYDEQGRVIRFVGYKRGEVVWQAVFAYRADGTPLRREVTDAQGQSVPLPEP